MKGKKINQSSVFYSIVSIAIVLFLVSSYGILFLHAGNISNLVKEKINIIVELKDHADQGSKDRLMKRIGMMDGVRSGSVRYIPKEEAGSLMEDFFSELSIGEDIVPFKDVITFNLNAADYNERNVKEISQKIKEEPGVIGIYAENDTIEQVRQNVQRFSYISLLVGLIFVAMSLSIIYNTIRLKLHGDRMEIKTMQIVGATRVFIARPYIKEAIFISVKAFMIVTFMFLILFGLLYLHVGGVFEIINWFYIGMVLACILIGGIVMTVALARMVVKSYLDAKTSSLI